ncbi:hypothetical protein TUMSATVNIG1_37940 [Vibrio nigripulchritudo]|uniref:hypothetical protein n=1 Tax=Vibrio nigripulchritudo TaxID=28173 RepID=UPI00190E2614|nr:hypothetical protein [Vibrio nigripulchritudo]BCL71827.1 hypothetical protein VNTUMSATTG_37640 [Vibrio nigripulchritudo]BDU33185.1 hypothetical protein TUMSATVNIG1_37940 [Vibrio nigripulchritudo]
MSVYQLKADHENYNLFELDMMQLASQLGDENLVDFLLDLPDTQESLKTVWKNVSSEFESDLSKPFPDITTWDINFLLLNEKAYDVTKELLENVGEFLPILVNGSSHFVFHCQSFGLEDPSKTEMKYEDGYPSGLKTLEFHEPDVRFKAVFKSKLQGASKLFANEHLKQLCDNNELRGLRFDSDLINPF